ncbi:GNAT family N-acetyltransferase [Paenibacillus sp. 2RAB27]|uniref:GNAT family N-acetyltransferase n=1 Tax=Paenibacillus sp. 2RAB27 TaxID=3232991 RepID=UPI003F9DA340
MQVEQFQLLDGHSLRNLYTSVTQHLRREGVKQWDRFYPNRFIIQSDLQSGSLFGVKQSNTVIAAVVVNEKQSSRYDILDWTDRQGKPACVHRLAVHPEFQRRGLGKILLGFAEQYALDQTCTSIRLDVFSANDTAVRMYEQAGYERIGTIRFPFRQKPYYCFEKILGSRVP